MGDPLGLLLAWVAGGVLGAFFFGGLWWTVVRAVSAERPALWFFGSLLARTSMALAGFYAFAGGPPVRLLACLVGFLMARLLVTRLTRSWGDADHHGTSEVGHAP